jgi:voltage-gated potassium channel Kch
VPPEAPDDLRRERPGVLDRVAEHFRARASRAIETRRIFRYLAGAMLLLSLGAGVLAWLVDRRDFATLGDALWWALVTLATVGYGDIVPQSAWGRVIGSAVIVMGVTFLAILTATVTSYLVSAEERERAAEADTVTGAARDETQALLHEVLDRLDALEQKLDRTHDPDPTAPRG